MDYWRGSTTKVVERASSEYRAKKPLVDVILVHYAEMRYLFREKIVGRYDSPMFADFTNESIDPELRPRHRDPIHGLGHNKSIVKPKDPPKALEGLLKAAFRGKFVMPDPTQHTTTPQWVAS